MGKRIFRMLAVGLGLAISWGFAAAAPNQGAPGQNKTAASGLGAGMVGMAACVECHKDTGHAFKGTPHVNSPLACEGCHGPGKAHVDSDGDKTKIRTFKSLTPAESSAVCLTCHDKGGQKHWAGSAHDSSKVACITCHNPHPEGKAPKALLSKPQFELCTSCHLQKKAALMRSGHMPMREGKMNCTSCHNPHGSPNDKQLLQSSMNQNCYSCHTEKRGPFLYEHPPVRENCGNCHDPHGSINDNLLKLKSPILCQQCHIGTRHPGQLHTFKDRYAFNKGCVDCHPRIHGSSHPTGMRFWR